MFPQILVLVLALFEVCSNLPLDQNESEIFNKGNSSTNLDTLLLAQVLFRHGDRTPLIDLKTSEYSDYMRIYGVDGYGQLTPIGRQQTFYLGKYLRQRYNGYLALNYSREEIYVQSSDVDRTIESAMSCLQGLYPQNSSWGNMGNIYYWNPIPVHVLTASADNKIGFTKPCQRYKDLFDKNLNSLEFQELNEKNKDFYNYLQNHTMNRVSSFEHVYQIYDTLFINKLYNLELPKWTGGGIFPEQIFALSQIGFWVFTATEEMKRLFMGPLLEEIIGNVETRLNSKKENKTRSSDSGKPTQAKLHLFAGQDITISSLLNVLGIFNGVPPSYTAALMIEIHRLPNSTSNEVKLFYRPGLNDVTSELFLPNCGNPCKFEDFKLIYSNYSNSVIGWDAECEKK